MFPRPWCWELGSGAMDVVGASAFLCKKRHHLSFSTLPASSLHVRHHGEGPGGRHAWSVPLIRIYEIPEMVEEDRQGKYVVRRNRTFVQPPHIMADSRQQRWCPATPSARALMRIHYVVDTGRTPSPHDVKLVLRSSSWVSTYGVTTSR